jgi:hypothetical protein
MGTTRSYGDSMAIDEDSVDLICAAIRELTRAVEANTAEIAWRRSQVPIVLSPLPSTHGPDTVLPWPARIGGFVEPTLTADVAGPQPR